MHGLLGHGHHSIVCIAYLNYMTYKAIYRNHINPFVNNVNIVNFYAAKCIFSGSWNKKYQELTTLVIKGWGKVRYCYYVLALVWKLQTILRLRDLPVRSECKLPSGSAVQCALTLFTSVSNSIVSEGLLPWQASLCESQPKNRRRLLYDTLHTTLTIVNQTLLYQKIPAISLHSVVTSQQPIH